MRNQTVRLFEQLEKKNLLSSAPWGVAQQVLPVGDWNSDGYDDVAVVVDVSGDEARSDWDREELRIYLGGEDGLNSKRFRTWGAASGISISLLEKPDDVGDMERPVPDRILFAALLRQN